MNVEEILSRVDHTLLSQGATWEDIRGICDDGIRYSTASVCIPASYVKAAKEYVGDRLKICTVIGFPNGYSTTAVKVFEAADAVKNGADEIDMVINIGWAKDSRWDDLLEEIRAVKSACGDRILKVIIETCLLTDEEKIELCKIVSKSGADFIKTSTGFAGGGAVVWCGHIYHSFSVGRLVVVGVFHYLHYPACAKAGGAEGYEVLRVL